MLPLGKIISEAGLSFRKYAKLAAIEVDMYDRKRREVEEHDFNFGGKLFAKNPDSSLRFQHILDSMLREPIPKKISARITDDYLVIYRPNYKAEILLLF